MFHFHSLCGFLAARRMGSGGAASGLGRISPGSRGLLRMRLGRLFESNLCPSPLGTPTSRFPLSAHPSGFAWATAHASTCWGAYLGPALSRPFYTPTPLCQRRVPVGGSHVLNCNVRFYLSEASPSRGLTRPQL